MSITYTKYHPNTKKATRYNGVILFASGYGIVRFICQLPDGKTGTIMLQNVVHLPASHNHSSLSQVMDQDVKVDLVCQYSHNIDNCHRKLTATAGQVNGLFVPDHVLDLVLGITAKCDCEGCIIYMLAQKPFTPRTLLRH